MVWYISPIQDGKFNDYLLKKKIAKYGVVTPEARSGKNVYIADAFSPCSLLIIRWWCLNYHAHWVTPLINTALFGFTQMNVIGITITYFVHCLPGTGGHRDCVN